MNIEPTWKRIGLQEPPMDSSGHNVCMIILDDIIPLSSISHLKGRVKRVKVHKDLTVTCNDIFQEPLQTEVDAYFEHGLKVLNLLAHKPIVDQGNLHKGLAPSANFIFLPASHPNRIKAGIEWILNQDWNPKIVLNLFVPQERGWMSPTSEDPYVRALQPAIDAGLLVIAAGGNSRVHNNLHPSQFFVVSGFNDKGLSDPKNYEVHPSAACGLNGDGHWRPDILAPYTYLPLPNLTGQGMDYFAGTCGTSTVVTGLIAHIWSQIPNLTPNEMRNVLMDAGEVLEGFPAPIANGDKAIRMLTTGKHSHRSIFVDPMIKVTDEDQSILSTDPLERSLALTLLIKKGKKTREEIWRYINDVSPMVKKVAIRGLGFPINETERERYWNQLHLESSGFGVKEDWAYMLLETSSKEELPKWLDLIKLRSIDIQICIGLFLRKYYPEAPELEPSPDPDPEIMDKNTVPLLEWYRNSVHNTIH